MELIVQDFPVEEGKSRFCTPRMHCYYKGKCAF